MERKVGMAVQNIGLVYGRQGKHDLVAHDHAKDGNNKQVGQCDDWPGRGKRFSLIGHEVKNFGDIVCEIVQLLFANWPPKY